MSKYYPDNSQQLKFLVEALNITSTSRGIDLGCDEGSHLKPLQKISPTIYGVDIRNQKLDKNFFKLDFFQEPLPVENLDFAYILAPYFKEQWWNIEVFFKHINQSLKNGGVFLLDLFDFNTYKIGSKTQRYKVKKDNIVLSTYIRDSDRVLLERVSFVNGEKKKIEGVWRVFTFNEISEILAVSGFYIYKQYAGFDKSENVSWNPSLEKRRIILLCKKFG